MPARQKSCCFTGHRPAKLPWGYREEDPRCVTLKARISDAVTLAWQEGYRHFICGMAQGCDLYFCEAVLVLREQHPEITVEAAIPLTRGRKRNGSVIIVWWRPATWKQWFPGAIRPVVCSGGTVIWWTTLCC